jgi:glycosyltransferase involved in cell wall biosynthesis
VTEPRRPHVSVVVSSYNYARFLRTSIDSILGQSYPLLELIVVDDGSTDESPEIIDSYGSRVVALCKANGGQASALNAGVRASRGDILVFVDSDDALFPDAIEKAVASLREPGASKVHWNLAVADSEGTISPAVIRKELSQGDLREAVLRGGADGYKWPPTSGNAWTRAFVDKTFPIPEREFTTCPDFYLATLAPMYGAVRRIDEPLGFWRHHPVNRSCCRAFEQNLREGKARSERSLAALEEHGLALGLRVDGHELRRNSRWHQMDEALQRVEEIVPAGCAFVLVDQDEWATEDVLRGRRRFLFIEEDGEFWGFPADDAMAIWHLELLRTRGAEYIVFPWPYLWWLEYYRGFVAYLRSHYRLRVMDDRVVVFELCW